MATSLALVASFGFVVLCCLDCVLEGREPDLFFCTGRGAMCAEDAQVTCDIRFTELEKASAVPTN